MNLQVVGIIIIVLSGIALLGGLFWVGLRENSGQDPLQNRPGHLEHRHSDAAQEQP